MKKRYFVIILILIIGFFSYQYIYKSHRIIKNETPHYSKNSSDLINDFTSNYEIASQKYIDKTIQLTGVISAINETSLEIDNKIICYFSDMLIDDELLNNSVTIKGRCIGYDDLLEELKMDQCIIIKNN